MRKLSKRKWKLMDDAGKEERRLGAAMRRELEARGLNYRYSDYDLAKYFIDRETALRPY